MKRSLIPLRLFPAFSFTLLCTLAPASAQADDKAACLAAASTGQSLRDQGKLVEAREQFRRCAAQGCPQMVVQDCGTWLSDLEKNLPTVVVTAKDGSGNDLVDVKVTLDGQPLLTKLTGEAIPLDPGPHSFHFETATGTRVDRQVLVKQGDKNQEVAAVLGAPPAAPAPVAPASSSSSATPAPASPASSPSSAWRTTGWVLGGLGVVGMGIGTVFGIISMNDKNSAHCDSNNFCDPGPLDSGRSAATGADVGFIAGGALLVGGLVVLLLAPSGGDATGSLHVTPLVGTSSAGASFAGSFQ
jgi:hypothetical protein